jgi:hypothetical protein
MTLKHQLKTLAKEYPLIPYTDASRTFSMVRRMEAEKENGIPIAFAPVMPFLQKIKRQQTK